MFDHSRKLKDYSLFNAKKELFAIEFFSAIHIIQTTTLQINIKTHLQRNKISWQVKIPCTIIKKL